MAEQVAYSDAVSEAPTDQSVSLRNERICFVCEQNFRSANLQKFRCKSCQHAVCDRCSKGKLFSFEDGKTVRVCSKCCPTFAPIQQEDLRQRQIDELKRKLQEQDAKFKKERAEMKDTQTQLTKAMENLNKLEIWAQDSAKFIRNLQEKLDKAKGVKDGVKEELTASNEEVKELRTNVEKANKTVRELKASMFESHEKFMTEKKERADELSAKLAVKEEKQKALIEELETEKRAEKDLARKKQSLSRSIEDLHNRFEGVKSEKRAIFEQITDLKAKLEATQSELTETKAATGGSEDIFRELKEAEKAHAEKVANADNLLAKITKKKEKLTELKTKSEKLDLEHEFTIATMQLQTVEKCIAEDLKQISELENTTFSQNEKSIEISEANRVKMEELSVLRSEHSSLSTQASEKQPSFDQAKGELEKLKAELEEKGSRIEELEKRIAELKMPKPEPPKSCRIF